MTIDRIIKIVTTYFDLPPEAVYIMSRRREIVHARQIVHYFAHRKTNNNLREIGFLVGRKDHSTVLHSIKVVNNLYETDNRFKGWVDDIEKKLLPKEQRIIFIKRQIKELKEELIRLESL